MFEFPQEKYFYLYDFHKYSCVVMVFQQQLNHQKIFGVSLASLEFTEVKLSNGAICRIPLFVSDACSRIMDEIEMEGIFRKAGSAARQKEIRVS